MAKSRNGQRHHVNCQSAISTTTTPQIHGGIVSGRGTKNSLRHFGQKFGPSGFRACTTNPEQWGQTQWATGVRKAPRQTDVAVTNTTNARQPGKVANMGFSCFPAPCRRCRSAVSRTCRIGCLLIVPLAFHAVRGERRHAYDGDQGDYGRVFRLGQSVFGDEESSYLLYGRLHHRLNRVARRS